MDRDVQRIVLTASLSLLFGSAAAAQSRLAGNAATLDRIVRAQADSGFTGVVLIAKGDSIMLHRAYSRSPAGLTPESAFWIASITKSFTAAAILELANDHRLSVRDSLYRFFPDAPKDKRAITVHQLLTHSSGIADANGRVSTTDRATAVRGILSAPLEYAPGKGYRYENSDYRLLAAIIEVVTGQSWQQVVTRRVLDPLELRHTGFWCTKATGVPIPVAGINGGIQSCTADWGHRGPDGMSSTAADVLKWVRAVSAPAHRADIGGVALPQVKVRDEPPYEVFYGYGARVYVRSGVVSEVLHSGSGDDGHTSIALRTSGGLTVIVLSNAGFHGRGTWSSYVAQLLAPR